MKKVSLFFMLMLSCVFSFAATISGIITNANNEAKETVDILRVAQKDGISGYVVVTEKSIKKYSILKKEYTSDMVLANEMDTILNKYTKYYTVIKVIAYIIYCKYIN